jgi:hypothetical protein
VEVMPRPRNECVLAAILWRWFLFGKRDGLVGNLISVDYKKCTMGREESNGVSASHVATLMLLHRYSQTFSRAQAQCYHIYFTSYKAQGILAKRSVLFTFMSLLINTCWSTRGSSCAWGFLRIECRPLSTPARQQEQEGVGCFQGCV